MEVDNTRKLSTQKKLLQFLFLFCLNSAEFYLLHLIAYLLFNKEFKYAFQSLIYCQFLQLKV